MICFSADCKHKNVFLQRTSTKTILTKKKNLGNCRLWNGRKMRILEAKKEKRRKTSEAFFRVIFPRVKICKFSFSFYKDQRKSGRLRHFTNVGLFFLSIPIPGFVPSDRFAWNGPVRLSFTDRRNSSQARQTPPVGRSENLTGPSFLLQWSSATKPCIFRQHYRTKKESFIEWKSRPPWPEYGYLGYLIGLFL